MADYIKREDVLSLKHRLHNPSKDTIELYPVYVISPNAVEKIPSADVVEVRHGKWIDKTMSVPNGHGQTYGKYGCSLCKGKVRYKTAFCPNCGARMDGE